MSAVSLTPTPPAAIGELEREILARIDRGGVAICEAELRDALRWQDEQGELLDVLAELESRGLVESALHFRLTDRGRGELPDAYEPLLRAGAPMPWKVERSSAGRGARSRRRSRA